MAKKERKLTPAEMKRKERFEQESEELAQQGYEKKDLTISAIAANILGIAIMIPVLILMVWGFFAVNGERVALIFHFKESILFLLAILVLIVVHEGIHGLTWALFAKEHLGAIEFGVIWTMLMPYCTCKAPLTKWQYIIGGLAPTVVVGLIPAILAVSGNHFLLLLIGLVMTLSGGGDALIVLKLLLYKENGKGSIYMDHPYECGTVVFERKE